MKELMIDDELRDLLPPLSLDEKEQLERNLLKNGYVGSPIYTWKGYIVDGHNRYEICTRNNIEFTDEELLLGENSTKVDVMEWMINTQIGRRNLTPAQKIIVGEKFKASIQKEAKEKQSQAGKEYGKGSNSFSPIGEKLLDKKIHTDKEIAKIVGVGTGTIGRWNQVKKLADDELKKKVVTGEVTISKAYDIVKGNDRPKVEDSKQTKDGVASVAVKENNRQIHNDSVKQIISDMKVTKNAYDYWNFLREIECVEENFKEPIQALNDVLFVERDISGMITNEEKEICISCIDDIVSQILELKNKIKNVKTKGDN